jgi:hypothetical protein
MFTSFLSPPSIHIFIIKQLGEGSLKQKKPLGKRFQRLLCNFGGPAVMAFQL